LDWSEEEYAEASKDEDEDTEVYLIEDPFLGQIHGMLTKKFPLCKKKPQEDFGCLATEDLRSTGIMELKEAGESQDLDSFGMLENNNSDDLLL